MRVNLHRQTRGDTLVEVLIAIAVVSSVLGIAYSIMNRNIITMRDNQERSEATRQAQTQVESLKAFWDVPTDRQAIEGVIGSFCVSDDDQIITLGASVPAPTVDDETDFAGYETGTGSCRFGGLYNTAIVKAAGTNRFTVYVRWDSLNSRVGKNEVVIVYGLD